MGSTAGRGEVFTSIHYINPLRKATIPLDTACVEGTIVQVIAFDVWYGCGGRFWVPHKAESVDGSVH